MNLLEPTEFCHPVACPRDPEKILIKRLDPVVKPRDDNFMSHLIYFFALILLTSGLFIMLTSHNYIHKVIGLGVFQSSVLVFYLALGKVKTGIVPIMQEGVTTYTSPLPHVLMLTAIVVGFATLSVALSLIYQIYKHFGTISENEISFDT